MKRIFGISLAILLITNTAMVKGYDSNTNELVDMASMMIVNDLEIDSFEVTIKEYMETSRLDKIVQELSTGNSVTMEENENSKIYSVRDTHKKGTLYVTYSAVFPKNKQYQSELIVTIQGDKWNHNVKSTYLETLSKVTWEYFTDDAKLYACMSSRASAIIDNDYVVGNFTEKLRLRHITTQNDTLKTTRNLEIIYGYTSLWGQKITIQDTPVNVQIVTKHVGNGDVQFTIGTPILINEY